MPYTLNEVEPGTEVFRPFGEVDPPVALAFGPLDGHGPRWSLYQRVAGALTRRAVLDSLRPDRAALGAWLERTVGNRQARALTDQIGPLRRFYRIYFQARPDLERDLALTEEDGEPASA